ncbi:MAG: NAD(P)H-dependent oxidoreductase, partial [Alphaproteobacteria bacterium]
YAENFDPVMTRAERLDYHDTALCRAPVATYVDRLLAAEALVLIFPVWNYGYPAILKGFFDRVFLPGVSFDLHDGAVRPTLHNIRRLTAVVTYGGNRWRTMVMGDPPRRIVRRSVRGLVHPRARTKYLALYDLNNANDVVRRKFIERVDREITTL